MTQAYLKGQKAKEYFLKGYNCSQSVAMAYADEIGFSVSAVARMTSGFGGGIGRLREVCGAVSGAVTVLSILCGYERPEDVEGKKQLYTLVQKFVAKFKEANGSYVCADLLKAKKQDDATPSERTNEYYAGRPCAELVRLSAEILYDFIVKED